MVVFDENKIICPLKRAKAILTNSVQIILVIIFVGTLILIRVGSDTGSERYHSLRLMLPLEEAASRIRGQSLHLSDNECCP